MSHDVIEAAVQVGAEVTRYLRCGRGQDVVVIIADDPAERIRLLHEAARLSTVIAPVLVADEDIDQCAGRLRRLLEGLGVEEPRLVAAPGLEPVLAALAPPA